MVFDLTNVINVIGRYAFRATFILVYLSLESLGARSTHRFTSLYLCTKIGFDTRIVYCHARVIYTFLIVCPFISNLIILSFVYASRAN